jgi:drug/metabolite transporter (DMT)-like permease
LPLADAIASTFAGPLFLTALSWPLLREQVSRERWIPVSVGCLSVLVMARPSGAGSSLGMLCARRRRGWRQAQITREVV